MYKRVLTFRWLGPWIGAVVSVALLVLEPFVQAQDAGRDRPPPRDVVEEVEIVTDGIRAKAKVRIQKWIIDGHRSIEALDLPGFEGVRVVQLAAGAITTVIRGERVERTEGEWWTVPAEVPLGLVTENDSAILWAISVEKK